MPALAAMDNSAAPEPDLGLDEDDTDDEFVEFSLKSRCANPRIGAESGVNRDKSRFSHSTQRPDARPVISPEVETVLEPSTYQVGVVINWPHWNVE